MAEIDVRDHGARCDGRTDDRVAVQSALDAAAVDRGTVRIPVGRCRVETFRPGPSLVVPAGVHLRGAGRRRTTLVLTGGGNGYHELVRTAGDAVTLSDMTLRRGGPVTGVLVHIGGGRGTTVRDLLIAGERSRYPRSSLHGVRTGDEPVRDLRLERIGIAGCEYGLLQASNSATDIDGVQVIDSEFTLNSADDLGFNSPSGVQRNITVTGCDFSAGRGFAVSLANVQGVTIADNVFHGYVQEFVHIEDRSARVELRSNRFSGNRDNEADYYSFIFIVSGSNQIDIVGNRFRTSPATYPFRCVFAGPGGLTAAAPQGITIRDNDTSLARNCVLVDSYGGTVVQVLPD